MAKESFRWMVCAGSSMHPTLKHTDVLHVFPYNGKKIKRGDVVAFKSPQDGMMIVHRIHSVNLDGFRSIGDHNNRVDDNAVNIDNIIGRVAYLQRGNRRVKVWGGGKGHIYALTLRAARRYTFVIYLVLRHGYRWLTRKGIMRKLFPRLIKYRIVCFSKTHGRELQMFWGKLIIGRLHPGSRKWIIYRPFHLFIDEKNLPANSDNSTYVPLNT